MENCRKTTPWGQEEPERMAFGAGAPEAPEAPVEGAGGEGRGRKVGDRGG